MIRPEYLHYFLKELIMRCFRTWLVTLLGSLLICAGALAQDKVVYHIDNAETQATKGLRNIRNHLDVAPDTKIIVVTHADGVDFLMEGAKTPKTRILTMPRWLALSRPGACGLKCVKSPSRTGI